MMEFKNWFLLSERGGSVERSTVGNLSASERDTRYGVTVSSRWYRPVPATWKRALATLIQGAGQVWQRSMDRTGETQATIPGEFIPDDDVIEGANEYDWYGIVKMEEEDKEKFVKGLSGKPVYTIKKYTPMIFQNKKIRELINEKEIDARYAQIDGSPIRNKETGEYNEVMLTARFPKSDEEDDAIAPNDLRRVSANRQVKSLSGLKGSFAPSKLAFGSGEVN